MNNQYILDEIKRTTRENGGVVLGRARFFRETGIKDSDWKGKHWVRWSDVVKAAGFIPNKMTTAYDESSGIPSFRKVPIKSTGYSKASARLSN